MKPVFVALFVFLLAAGCASESARHYNLGLNYKNVGRDQDAVAEFKEAIRLQPDFTEAYNELGIVHSNLNQFQDAVAPLKESLRFAELKNLPKNIPHNNLGRAYVGLGRLEEAVAEFKESLLLKPDDALAHFNLGLTYNLLKDGASAISHMTAAENLFEKGNDIPKLAIARKNLREYRAKYNNKTEDFSKSP